VLIRPELPSLAGPDSKFAQLKQNNNRVLALCAKYFLREIFLAGCVFGDITL
jgi:hypothetical protein